MSTGYLGDLSAVLVVDELKRQAVDRRCCERPSRLGNWSVCTPTPLTRRTVSELITVHIILSLCCPQAALFLESSILHILGTQRVCSVILATDAPIFAANCRSSSNILNRLVNILPVVRQLTFTTPSTVVHSQMVWTAGQEPARVKSQWGFESWYLARFGGNQLRPSTPRHINLLIVLGRLAPSLDGR